MKKGCFNEIVLELVYPIGYGYALFRIPKYYNGCVGSDSAACES
jgi:hypothetical protein